jgi:hypothetical protein
MGVACHLLRHRQRRGLQAPACDQGLHERDVVGTGAYLLAVRIGVLPHLGAGSSRAVGTSVTSHKGAPLRCEIPDVALLLSETWGTWGRLQLPRVKCYLTW